ncbi:hypothetical protein HYX09_06145 [Candidatus Woesearchaeota archaeon]|nr:hypothetical protein [Candidatus Woesearchaeota archaeon]
MNIKQLLIGTILFVLLLNVVYAQNLVINDIDVKVGSKSSNNLKSGDSINKDAEPEDTIEFDVEFLNNFTQSSDPEIEDIEMTVTIEGVDGEDNDDMEEQASEFDLSPTRKKSRTVRFKLPLEIESQSYSVKIEAEGTDTNNTKHIATATLSFDVDKERDLLKVYRNQISPSEVSCNRKGVSHTLGIINIGEDEQENVIVSVTNSDLGINFQETVTEITSDTFDDESKYLKTLSYDLPADLESGNYPVNIKASYGSKTEIATANLLVNECVQKQAPKQEIVEQAPKQEEPENEFVEVITPTVPVILPPAVTQPIQTTPAAPAEEEATSEGVMSNRLVLGSIIAVEAIAVLAGIALVIHLARRK